MIVTIITMSLSALNDVNPGDPVFIGLKRLFLMIALPVEILVTAVYVSFVSQGGGQRRKGDGTGMAVDPSGRRLVWAWARD